MITFMVFCVMMNSLRNVREFTGIMGDIWGFCYDLRVSWGLVV